jgi:hypothetical protein
MVLQYKQQINFYILITKRKIIIKIRYFEFYIKLCYNRKVKIFSDKLNQHIFQNLQKRE